MLQVIQILAYACYFQPLLLLLDEPDSHLHSDSQSLLFEALNQLVETLDTHIVMASHSPQLLQRMTQRENVKVVWMEEGRQVELDDNQRPAVPVLMSLGALSFGVDAFSPDKKVILLTEDKNTELVKFYAEANGADNTLAIISYNGCPNLSGARQLAAILHDMRPETKIVIHRDRDFRTEEEMEFERLRFKKQLATDGLDRIEEIFTSGNDIEHRFCTIEHLQHCLNELPTDELQRYLDETIQLKRDDLVEKQTQARQTIKINVYDSPRLRHNENWEEAGMPARMPSARSLRQAEEGDTFPFSQCHGKELERALRQKIAAEIGGDFNRAVSSFHCASLGLEDPRWQGLF